MLFWASYRYSQQAAGNMKSLWQIIGRVNRCNCPFKAQLCTRPLLLRFADDQTALPQRHQSRPIWVDLSIA